MRLPAEPAAVTDLIRAPGRVFKRLFGRDRGVA